MPTYRLLIEYEGTRFGGWQEQPNARTVTGELRAAIAAVAGKVGELGGSGRTDAGVHALGQVAHLRLPRPVAPEPFREAVNDRLPADIHLLAVAPAPARFHARHDAVARSYIYQIARRRTAFAKRHVWWVKRRLDVRQMTAAADLCAGRHDFAAFCEAPAEQRSTLVVVERSEVASAGALVLVRLVASHFLWKMVRRIVGALVQVGAGAWTLDDLAALLERRPDTGRVELVAAGTAPPSGLFLERVLYRGDRPVGPLAAPVPVAAEPRPRAHSGRRPRPPAQPPRTR